MDINRSLHVVVYTMNNQYACNGTCNCGQRTQQVWGPVATARRSKRHRVCGQRRGSDGSGGKRRQTVCRGGVTTTRLFVFVESDGRAVELKPVTANRSCDSEARGLSSPCFPPFAPRRGAPPTIHAHIWRSVLAKRITRRLPAYTQGAGAPSRLLYAAEAGALIGSRAECLPGPDFTLLFLGMRNHLGVTLVRTTAREYSQRSNGADSRIAADATSNPPLGDIEPLFVALKPPARSCPAGRSAR